jgi:hypothetical protein
MGTSSQIPLWGRAYELTVYSAKGQETVTSNTWEPEALRITFDIQQTVLPSPYWYADIAVYNFNKSELYGLIESAYRVTLKAGYQTGQNTYGVIWDGPVLQMLFDRENVTDQKFTFHCIATIPLLAANIVQFSQGKLSTQAQVLERMVSQIGGDFQMNLGPAAQKALAAKQYPRGKTIFGRLTDYLKQLADDQFLVHYQDGVNAYLTEIATPGNALPPPAVTYSAPDPPGYVAALNSNGNISKTIIGVPRQTMFGCTFTVLLDPRLRVSAPPMLVHIDNSVIAQMKVMLGEIQTPLDVPSNFFAAQIHHRGDTRGASWYTEVNGFNPTYALGYLNGLGSPI